MRVPLSWLGRSVDVAGLDPIDIARRLTAAGLQVERIDRLGDDVENVVVAEVMWVEELTGFKKPVRWVGLSDGDSEHQVICGAVNFATGDLVAYARPPALLPGGLRIDRRPAYGHDSDGMICSARELGIGDDHTGIMVLGRAGELPLGEGVVDALQWRDVVLDIAVNPDRGYALSVRGVAREVAVAFGLGFADPADVTVPSLPGNEGRAVRIDDPAGCDRYVVRQLSGLDPAAPSPQWLQRRVAMAVMRPISLAVDVTNHVMLELGQPLHAFDADAVTGEVVVRRARAGERLRTLDDVDRELDPEDLVIADDSGPIALAGVMGGAATEISATTTSVLLESAHFDPVSIAYTARRHRLGSEASRRFERGVDHDLPPAAAEAAAHLLRTLGGAVDAAAMVDVDLRRSRPAIELAAALPAALTGLELTRQRVEAHLAAVGCTVVADAGESLTVAPPPWRPDLLRPVDLVEEIARLEGYDRLPVSVPRAPAGRGLTLEQRRRRAVSRELAAVGYGEVLSSPFVSEGVGDALLLPPGDSRRPTVRLANPVSEEQPMLRASLLPGLLDALLRNLRRGFADVALFETGPVFRAAAGGHRMPALRAGHRPDAADLRALEAVLPDQPLHLATVAAGRWEPSGWWGPGREAAWPDAIESARSAAAAIGAELTVRRAAEPGPWHPGRCAELLAGDVVVGHAGELHPRLLSRWELPERCCAMELSLLPVLAVARDAPSAGVLSPFPAATLDVAVVVEGSVPVADVAAALRAGAGDVLEQLRLFDVYRGDQIASGEVSYAFALRLRAADRTLTAAESTAVRDAAVDEAARRVGARLRG